MDEKKQPEHEFCLQRHSDIQMSIEVKVLSLWNAQVLAFDFQPLQYNLEMRRNKVAVSFYLYHKTTAPQEKRNGTEGQD